MLQYGFGNGRIGFPDPETVGIETKIMIFMLFRGWAMSYSNVRCQGHSCGSTQKTYFIWKCYPDFFGGP